MSSFYFGADKRGRQHFRNAVDIPEQIDDLVTLGHSLRFSGLGLLGLGSIQTEDEQLSRATELFETKVPEYWGWVCSRYWLTLVKLEAGEFNGTKKMVLLR